MPPPEDVTDEFYTERTWRQLQHDHHQRFLAQLKAEFRVLRQQSSPPRSVITYVPTPTANSVNGQRRERSRNTPQRPSNSLSNHH